VVRKCPNLRRKTVNKTATSYFDLTRRSRAKVHAGKCPTAGIVSDVFIVMSFRGVCQWKNAASRLIFKDRWDSGTFSDAQFKARNVSDVRRFGCLSLDALERTWACDREYKRVVGRWQTAADCNDVMSQKRVGRWMRAESWWHRVRLHVTTSRTWSHYAIWPAHTAYITARRVLTAQPRRPIEFRTRIYLDFDSRLHIYRQYICTVWSLLKTRERKMRNN